MDSCVSPWTGVVTSWLCTSDPRYPTNLALSSSCSLNSERRQHAPVASCWMPPFLPTVWNWIVQTASTWPSEEEQDLRSLCTIHPDPPYYSYINHPRSPGPPNPSLLPTSLFEKERQSLNDCSYLVVWQTSIPPPNTLSLSQRFTQVENFSSDSVCHLTLKQHRMDFFLHPLPLASPNINIL